MATIDDYSSGRIVDKIRKAEALLGNSAPLSVDESAVVAMGSKIREFDPVVLTLIEAMELVQNARHLASGERVCRAVFPESPETQSVFLDDLAAAMVEAGRGCWITAGDAEQLFLRQARFPLVASKVSCRYAEICAAWPMDCMFHKAERHGIHCLGRHGRDS